MMPWRKIAGLSSVASLMLGCTITTSDGGADSGTNWNETGGSGNTGGTTSTGGTAAGGSSLAGGTDSGGSSECFVSAYKPPPGGCDECLRGPTMCSDYLDCRAVSGCPQIVDAMTKCMAAKALDAGGTTVPVGSDVACRASTSGMSTSDTSAAAVAAQTFWTLISLSSCDHPCWVEGS